MITDSVSTEQLQEQLERLEEKLDRVLQYTQKLESRMEGLSEFREDFVPIVNDAAKLASAKLLQLEASGVLSAASGIGRALARPELMAALQRSLEVLSVAQDGADNAPVAAREVARRSLDLGRPHVVGGRIDKLARERHRFDNA